MTTHSRRHLLAYVEGTIHPRLRMAVDRHLAVCRLCASDLAELRIGYETARRIRVTPQHPDVIDRIVKRAIAGNATDAPKPELLRMPRTMALRAAAVIAILLAGSSMGYLLRGATSAPEVAAVGPGGVAEGRQFVFVLLEPDAEWPARRRTMWDRYRNWTRDLRASQHLIRGEKLTDDVGVLVHSDPVDSIARANTEPKTFLSGVFFIRATSYAEATALAQTSPHLRLGGSILVRQVD